MVIPIVISFFISSLFSENLPINVLNNNIDDIVIIGEKRVLAITDVFADKAEDFFYLRENKLPKNNNTIVFPKKIIKEEDFFSSAQAGVVIDENTTTTLWKKDMNKIRQIASITKLMTAIVFLETNPDWEQVYKIKKEDRREGGRIYVYEGDEIKIKDLFSLSLISSANTATMSLVNSTLMSEAEFVEKMNKKAIDMRLLDTKFLDPVGLSDKNISTARQIALLAKEAFLKDEIRERTSRKDYIFKTIRGREIKIISTNQLLNNFPKNGTKIISGKTGYTDTAGSCFVCQFENSAGNNLISVVLGAENNKKRFLETNNLIDWVYTNYEWNN